MQTKIQRWGNSQGIRFSKQILEAVQISTGDPVEITVEGDRIVIKAVHKKKYDLRELVSKMPKAKRERELNWGKPQGREEW